MKRWHVVIIIVACIAIIAYLALVVGRGSFPKLQTATVLRSRGLGEAATR